MRIPHTDPAIDPDIPGSMAIVPSYYDHSADLPVGQIVAVQLRRGHPLPVRLFLYNWSTGERVLLNMTWEIWNRTVILKAREV